MICIGIQKYCQRKEAFDSKVKRWNILESVYTKLTGIFNGPVCRWLEHVLLTTKQAINWLGLIHPSSKNIIQLVLILVHSHSVWWVMGFESNKTIKRQCSEQPLKHQASTNEPFLCNHKNGCIRPLLKPACLQIS